MLEQFLKDINPSDTIMEFTSIKEGNVNVITKEQALNNKTSNIYVLGGVNPKYVGGEGKRVKDSDILKKSYFCIDIDLRNNYKDLGEEISNEEIIQQGLLLGEELKTNKHFADWKYIVFTGNGLHIYYIGDEIEIPYEDYALGVSRIFKKFDKDIGSPYLVDHACKNIARILRLPGSINQKNNSEVKIIAQQNTKSKLIANLPFLANAEKQEIETENKRKQKEVEQLLSKFGGDENKIYEIITKQIPAWQIAQLIMPEFPYNGKRNFKNQKGGFTGYYYNESTNSICNGGSKHFLFDGDTSSCWDNFQLIKRSKNFTNAETFRFYKDLLNIKH